jgi:transposase-like protein
MAARASGPRPPCPTVDCPAPHVVRNGTLGGRRRYHCRGCGAWFGQTHGTPLYRLRTPPAEIGRALLVVLRRGSLRAAEEVTGHKYETIGHWLKLAAAHAEAIEATLVRDLELSAVEVDEFWSFVRRRTSTSGRVTRRMPATAGAA